MPSLNVKFKGPKSAKEFQKNFGIVGLDASIKINGSSATITTKDKKAHDFVKQMVLDLKADVKMESAMKKFVNAIVESVETKNNVDLVLLDKSIVSVNPICAEKFISFHDGIVDEDAGNILISLALESQDSFNRTMQFVLKEQE
jgi:hypothetical protein